MNKELVIYNGKLISIDENKCVREVKCVDNILDILLKENLIEGLENLKKELECSSKKFNRGKIKDFFEISLPTLSSITIPIIMSYLKDLPDVILTKNGSIPKEEFVQMFIVLFAPIGMKMSEQWYNEYKEKKGNEYGRIFAIKGLERSIFIKKQELEMMKEESRSCSIDSFISSNIKIELDKSLEDISRFISSCYKLGSNYKYIIKYYKKTGDLPKELTKDCREDEISFVKNALEEKNKSKVKKVKRNK